MGKMVWVWRMGGIRGYMPRAQSGVAGPACCVRGTVDPQPQHIVPGTGPDLELGLGTLRAFLGRPGRGQQRPLQGRVRDEGMG